MNCYNCEHFDANDVVHCYGTCELQDIDYRIDHVCNLNGKGIATSGATLQHWDSGIPTYSSRREWADTDLACPECGGQMQKELGVVYTSDPPQYRYMCKQCGHIKYRWE